jgi:hypothetical protein
MAMDGSDRAGGNGEKTVECPVISADPPKLWCGRMKKRCAGVRLMTGGDAWNRVQTVRSDKPAVDLHLKLTRDLHLRLTRLSGRIMA